MELNLIKREFTIRGNPVWLTNNEFNLMTYFMKHVDKVVEKEELADKVWGIKFDTQTNFINVYVSYLRKKKLPRKRIRNTYRRCASAVLFL